VKLIGCIKGVAARIKRDVNFQKEIEVVKVKLVIEQRRFDHKHSFMMEIDKSRKLYTNLLAQ